MPKASSSASLDETLLCQDRSIGHDFAQFTWSDGPSVTTGRGRSHREHYLCYRHSDCARGCGTYRREEFIQDSRLNELVKNTNRSYYRYTREWKRRTRLSPGQVRALLRAQTETRTQP